MITFPTSHRPGDKTLKARDDFDAWRTRRPKARVLVLKSRPRRAAGSPASALAVPVFGDMDSLIDALSEPMEQKKSA